MFLHKDKKIELLKSVPLFSHCNKKQLASIAQLADLVKSFMRIFFGSREEAAEWIRKVLVAGSGLAFQDRGTHELKGVPGEWRLYAVDTQQSRT